MLEPTPSSTDILAAIGRRLQLVRQAMGKTQAEFAEMMNVTPSAVSGWEVGRNAVDVVALVRLARQKTFSIDYVLLGTMDLMPISLMAAIQQIERNDQGVIGLRRRGRPKVGGVAVNEANRSESPVKPKETSLSRGKRRA